MGGPGPEMNINLEITASKQGLEGVAILVRKKSRGFF